MLHRLEIPTRASRGACLSVLFLLVGLAVSCTNDDGTQSAQGDLALPADLPKAEVPAAAAVDFVTAGCASLDKRCSGPAPMTLRFSLAVSGMPLSEGRWSFGDGSEALGASVTHRYAKPGTFTVSVSLSSPEGTVSETKVDFVQVDKAPAGASCSGDEGCESGKCVCTEGECPAPLSSGLCLRPCANMACAEGERCVLFGGAKGAPWREDACYPACDGDTQCLRPGFSCRQAPTADGWRQACLPPLLKDVASSCRRVDGTLDPAQCMGGRCLALGAGGYCSASCESGGCPAGSSCVEIVVGKAAKAERLCLQRCAPGACANDPWLACQTAGGSGSLAFTVVGPADPPGTMYCAARACLKDADCGVGGRCAAELGGYCAAP